MKVILKEDVEELGKAGDIVDVADGYGRNYLLPKGMVVKATSRNVGTLEHEKRMIEHRMNRLMSEAERLARYGVRLRFIGGRERLDQRLQALMAGIESRTADNDALHLTVAINYGGRDEIARAARWLARDVAAGRIAPEEVGEAALDARLDTADLPDPDLVIRTSGETRTSNFLPWQSAYAEYEFTPTLWPDFTPAELGAIIDRYAARERRFGGVITA